MTEIEWTERELNALAAYRHAETHEDAREAEEDLRALVADREAQSAAKALRETANRWQQGGWADDLPSKGAGRTEGIIGMAHRATAFLRDRADRIERGSSDD